MKSYFKKPNTRNKKTSSLNKYKNQSCKCNLGHNHDSIGEASYCNHLSLIKKVDGIKEILYQKSLPLRGENHTKICSHKVDFYVIFEDGREEIHEFKGFETAIWQLKRKFTIDNYPKVKYVTVYKKNGRFIFK
jgi:hypothetical protein